MLKVDAQNLTVDLLRFGKTAALVKLEGDVEQPLDLCVRTRTAALNGGGNLLDPVRLGFLDHFLLLLCSAAAVNIRRRTEYRKWE